MAATASPATSCRSSTKLDPAITTVDLRPYPLGLCLPRLRARRPARLLTSAGKYGYFVTDLRLEFDPATHRLIGQDATNVVVGNGERGDDPAMQPWSTRYAAAVAPIANRVIGRLTATATTNDRRKRERRRRPDRRFHARRDARRKWRRADRAGQRDRRSRRSSRRRRAYKDAFAMMPFGNNLVVMTLTGAQLKAALEQQYAIPLRPEPTMPAVLAPSGGFTYAVDMSPARKAAGFPTCASTANRSTPTAATGSS